MTSFTSEQAESGLSDNMQASFFYMLDEIWEFNTGLVSKQISYHCQISQFLFFCFFSLLPPKIFESKAKATTTATEMVSFITCWQNVVHCLGLYLTVFDFRTNMCKYVLHVVLLETIDRRNSQDHPLWQLVIIYSTESIDCLLPSLWT